MNDSPYGDPLKEIRQQLEHRINANASKQQALFDELETLQAHERALRDALKRVVGGNSDVTPEPAPQATHTPQPEAKVEAPAEKPKPAKRDRSGDYARRKRAAAKRVLPTVLKSMPPKFTTKTFMKYANGIPEKTAVNGLSGLKDLGYLTVEFVKEYQGGTYWVKTEKLEKNKDVRLRVTT